MSGEFYTRGEVALWIQPGGPNTAPVYLGCHQMDSISEPLGDNKPIQAPDPSRPNAYRTVGKVKGQPGLVSTSIKFRIQEALDYLETLSCPATLFAHLRGCGRADLFTNYDRTFVLRNADVTARSVENLAAIEAGEDTVGGSADIQADPPVLRIKGVGKIVTERQVTTEVRSALGMWFYDSAQCPGCCPNTGPGCQRGYITTTHPTGSATGVGHVLYTVDGGATWKVTAANPFGAGEDVGAVVAFYTAPGTVRVIVARATSDAGHPAEVAYSDDNGATWTNVDVGSTNGEYIANGNSMWALDRSHIWAVTNQGNVYFSADGGETWTLQFASGVNLNAVHFYDTKYGVVGGTDGSGHGWVAYSTNGGETWTETDSSPDNLSAIWMTDSCHWWVANDTSGYLEYTNDSGATWNGRNLPNQALIAEAVACRFINPLVGYVVVLSTVAVAHLYRTIDGGYTWEEIAIPDNSGVASLWLCNVNEFYIAGPTNGGTTFIAHGE